MPRPFCIYMYICISQRWGGKKRGMGLGSSWPFRSRRTHSLCRVAQKPVFSVCLSKTTVPAFYSREGLYFEGVPNKAEGLYFEGVPNKAQIKPFPRVECWDAGFGTQCSGAELPLSPHKMCWGRRLRRVLRRVFFSIDTKLQLKKHSPQMTRRHEAYTNNLQAPNTSSLNPVPT